ncbi:MAG TPA: hypothetical protein VJ810_33745 [Blastocatellia bacterium]|nr:hypothetical protein [Blastocatellia bacterium]
MKRWLNAALIFLFLLSVGWVGYDRYVRALWRAKEVVLQRNLWTVRRAIDDYWQDCEKPPQALQELINTGYLREIPVDPLTKSNQTWILEREK